jgi:hypothetical protein
MQQQQEQQQEQEQEQQQEQQEQQEYQSLRKSYIEHINEKNYESAKQILSNLTKLNRNLISKDFKESLFGIDIKLLIDAFFKSKELHKHFFVFIELLKSIDKKLLKSIDKKLLQKNEIDNLIMSLNGPLSFCINIENIQQLKDLLSNKKNIISFQKFLEILFNPITIEKCCEDRQEIMNIIIEMKKILNDVKTFEFAYFVNEIVFHVGTKTSTDTDMTCIVFKSCYISWNGEEKQKSIEYMKYLLELKHKTSVDLTLIIVKEGEKLSAKLQETLRIIDATQKNFPQEFDWEKIKKILKFVSNQRDKNDLWHKLYNLIECSLSFGLITKEQATLEYLRDIKKIIDTRDINKINFQELLNMFLELISHLKSVDSILSNSIILELVKKITLRTSQALWLFISPLDADLSFMYNTFEHILKASELPLIQEIFGEEAIYNLSLFMFRFFKGSQSEYHTGQLITNEEFHIFLNFVEHVIKHINQKKKIELIKEQILTLLATKCSIIGIFNCDNNIIVLTDGPHNNIVIYDITISFVTIEQNLSCLRTAEFLYRDPLLCLYESKIQSDPENYNIIENWLLGQPVIALLIHNNKYFVVVSGEISGLPQIKIDSHEIILISCESLKKVLSQDFIHNPVYYEFLILLLLVPFEIKELQMFQSFMESIVKLENFKEYLKHHYGRNYSKTKNPLEQLKLISEISFAMSKLSGGEIPQFPFNDIKETIEKLKLTEDFDEKSLSILREGQFHVKKEMVKEKKVEVIQMKEEKNRKLFELIPPEIQSVILRLVEKGIGKEKVITLSQCIKNIK